MTRYLNRLFNVRATEWPRLLLLYLMAFLFIVGITWGELTVQASFLFKVGYESLPQVLVINAIVSIIAIAVYTPFVDRIANDRLLISISVISAVAIGISYALLGLDLPNIAYPLLYLLSLIVRQTFNLQWWTYVNSYYDTRAAKRIIPMLSTASRIAVIVSGQTMPLLNLALSSGNIVLVWMGTLVVVALLAWLMPYLLEETRDTTAGVRASISAGTGAQPAPFIKNARESYHYVSQSPYLRWLAWSTLFTMLLLALLEYHTSEIFVSSGSFASEKDLSSFLGRWSSWSSLVLLPFQLFLFGRLVGRMGLGNANLIFPVGTLAICGSLISWPQILTASLGYLDIKIFRTVFRNPTDNLLYNAIPLRVKGRARAFIAGLIAPVGSLIGGVLLLLSQTIPVEWFLPALIGVTAAVYMISALFVRKQYTQALVTMLEQEDFSFLLSAPSDLAVTDAVTLNWLTRKLRESTSRDFTIFMAKLISEVGGDEAVPILGPVVREAAPHVRSTIIDILAAADVRGDAAGQLYTEFVADPDERVRRSAIAGLERWAGPESEQFLTLALELLDDPDIEARAQVILPLVQSGDFFYLATASQTLAQLLADEDARHRARGVRVLGQVGDVRFIRNLVQHLADPDDQVRLEAAVAIETLSRDQIPAQIAAVVVEHLDPLLRDPVERVRQAAVTILGHVDTPETHRALVHFLTDPSPQIRDAAIEALVSIGKPVISTVSPALDSADPQRRKMATTVLSRIDREQFGTLITSRVNDSLRTIYHNHNRLEALSSWTDHASVSVLQSMLREQNDQLTDEIFYLLTAIHGRETVEVIAESLHSESARVRANATEALESLSTPQTARLIAPLFDPEFPPKKLLRIDADTWNTPRSDTTEVIRQLATDPDDPWLRTIMTFALGEIGAALSPKAKQPAPGLAADDVGRRKRRGSLHSQTAGLFDKLADTPENGSPQPSERQERHARRARPADILDKLVAVPTDTLPQPSEQEERKPLRARPADLLDKLLEVSDDTSPQPDGETETPDQPTAYDRPVLTLQEIEAMLDASLADPVADVRIAAQAAKRMIAGRRITDVTPEEETVLSTIERIIFLKEATFFQGMTVDHLKVLATICEEELFPEDSQIFDQGDPGGAMYVVVSGRVAIERAGQRKGSTVHLATIDAHSCFGEMSLFDNSPRSAAARTIQDTLTLRLRREPLVALVRQYPDLGMELINILSQRLRNANDRIAQLSRSRPRELQKLYDQLV